ncbi:MAG: hypothetical protein KDD47_20785, partial [Acidobacteria bacterium]|nr:hypothetical protein [Acidobacteriota bacterium]
MASRRLLLLILLLLFPLCATASPPPFVKHWQTSYNRPVPGFGDAEDWALSVLQTSDGGYLAAGFTEIECPAKNALERSPHLIKVDPHGRLLWQTAVDFGRPCDYGQFQEVIETADAYVAVGIKKVTPAPGLSPNRIGFAKVKKSTGEVLVQRILHLTTNFQSVDEQSTARGIREVPGGGFVVVGSGKVNAAPADAFFLRLDAAGNVLDLETYDLAGEDDEIFAIDALQENGAFAGYILGGSSEVSGGRDAVLRRVDPTGAEQWSVQIASEPSGAGFLQWRHWAQGTPGGWLGLSFPGVGAFPTTLPCDFQEDSGRDRILSVQQTEKGEILAGALLNEIQASSNASSCGAGSPFEHEYRAGEGGLLRVSLDGILELAVNPAVCAGLDFNVLARGSRGPGEEGYVFSCTVASPGALEPGHVTEAVVVTTDLDGLETGRRQFIGDGAGACIFDMEVANDGGFVFAGSNTAHADDSVLAKLYSPC